MKNAAYLLSIGVMVSLIGFGFTVPIASPPALVLPNAVVASEIASKPASIAPVTFSAPTKATTVPSPKKVTAPAPKPAHAAATKWVVTNTYSGNGVKKESFTITNDTRVTWEVTSVYPTIDGITPDSFNYYLKDSQGYPYTFDILFAHRSGVGKGTTYLKVAPGKYTLYTNAANCTWAITVEQQK